MLSLDVYEADFAELQHVIDLPFQHWNVSRVINNPPKHMYPSPQSIVFDFKPVEEVLTD